MSTAVADPELMDEEDVAESFADILHELGDVDPARVIWLPREATDEDQLHFCEGEPKRLCDLIDGVLVEKIVGQREALYAATLIASLVPFVRKKKLGMVGGADAIMRLRAGLNRLPDIAYTAWSSLPTDSAHLKPIADYPPDLAVEVISIGDRPGELARKRRDYFTAGTKLLWIVDPDDRTVEVFTGPDDSTTLTAADTLTGGNVLPGFELPLAELFDDPQLNPRPNS